MPEPSVPRVSRGRRRARAGKGRDVLPPPPPNLGRSPMPERLQQVLDRAELVIAETRRVIRDLLRDLRRQQAAARQVTTGQPRVQRRRTRRRTRGRRRG